MLNAPPNSGIFKRIDQPISRKPEFVFVLEVLCIAVIRSITYPVLQIERNACKPRILTLLFPFVFKSESIQGTKLFVLSSVFLF